MGYIGNTPTSTPLTSSDLEDNIISTAKLQNNAITNPKVSDDAIGLAELSATGTASSSTFLRGDNSWASAGETNTPYFFAYRGTSEQSIGNASLTIIQFNAELYDSGSCFDTSTYKFTPNVAGKYWINATVRMGTSTDASSCQVEIFKNTSSFNRVNMNNVHYTSIVNSAIVDMNGSSDYIQAKIYQDTGGSANIQYNSDSTYQTFLQGFLIGA